MKDKKILITGASGMLGSALIEKLRQSENQLFLTTFPDAKKDAILLDITNPEAVSEVLKDISPDIVYNCAAYTNVDTAQSDIKTTMAVNAEAPAILAENCKTHNSLFVHISTDYVFNGNSRKPYKPDDTPCPNTIYGKSKLEGEKAITETGCNNIIIRTSWLFGPYGKNFVETIINLAKTRDRIKVVNDQTGKPTYSLDLADCMIKLARKKTEGFFHFSNCPECTWYEFACEIVKTAGLECRVEPCTTADFPRPAPRPEYSVLDTSKTEEILPGAVRPWRGSLFDYIDSYGTINEK